MALGPDAASEGRMHCLLENRFVWSMHWSGLLSGGLKLWARRAGKLVEAIRRVR